MLIDDYINENYNYEVYLHNHNNCTCDLKEGGKGLCLIGQYLEGVITAREYLKIMDNEYFDLEFGMPIKTRFGDIARVVGILNIRDYIYFVLDREVLIDEKNLANKSNKIQANFITKHSSKLKDLVDIGDIANGKEIIRIDNRQNLVWIFWK